MAKRRKAQQPSLAELFRMASQRQSELQSRKAELENELEQVARELQAANKSGRGRAAVPKPTRTRRQGAKGERVIRRANGQPPLREVLIGALRENPKGLELQELAASVLQTGYQTQSKNFENTVYQCVYGAKEVIICDKRSGKYRLKGRQTTAGKTSD